MKSRSIYLAAEKTPTPFISEQNGNRKSSGVEKGVKLKQTAPWEEKKAHQGLSKQKAKDLFTSQRSETEQVKEISKSETGRAHQQSSCSSSGRFVMKDSCSLLRFDTTLWCLETEGFSSGCQNRSTSVIISQRPGCPNCGPGATSDLQTDSVQPPISIQEWQTWLMQMQLIVEKILLLWDTTKNICLLTTTIFNFMVNRTASVFVYSKPDFDSWF